MCVQGCIWVRMTTSPSRCHVRISWLLWKFGLRGHAQWTFGHLDAAARDLADASAALADEPERPELASLRDAVADSQIRLSAARGDRAGLHTAIEAMLARSPIADIRLEVLMNDPQIRDLLPAERWDVLRRRHRPR